MGQAGGVGGGGRRSLSDQDRRLLQQGLAALQAPGGLQVTPSAQMTEALDRYLGELLLWSGRRGLVKFNQPRDLIVRHVLDSLAAAPVIDRILTERGLEAHRVRACDVGSGAGFPGVPLALYLPLGELVLLERSTARSAFLRTVCAVLNRPGLSVLESDLAGLSEPFDLLLVRALSPFDDATIARLSGAVAPAGALLFYQGRADSTAATAARLQPFFEDLRTIALSVPLLDAERHVIVARRITKSC